MRLKFLIFILLLNLAIVITNNVNISTEIHTTYGDIEGMRLKEDKVTVFLGIPYAQSPIKSLRFTEAKEPTPWNEVKKTKHWNKKCLPFRRHFESLEGYSEDCLFLNLLIPTQKASKTNLLLIFSNEELNVVKILEIIKREIAVGVVYFRQGLQGFASLTEESNYGISDIKLALDFIENNLQNFKIDGSIILASENDGSAALHYAFDEWLNDKQEESNKYKLMLLNGNRYIERFTNDNERTTKNTKVLFKKIDCDLPSDIQSLDCSKTKTFTEILKAYLKIDYPEEYGSPFRPKIKDLKKISKDYDMILGLETTLTKDYYHNIDEFDESYNYRDFKTSMARTISDKTFNNGPLIRRLVFHEYIRSIGNKKDTYFLWEQSRKIIQDKHYYSPTAKYIQNLNYSNSNIFLFKYDVPKPISTCLSAFLPEYLNDFCQWWWKFTLRFITKGAPTQKGCEEGKPKWPALGTTNRNYHVIMHDDGKLEWDFPLAIRADAFWNELVPIIDKLELKGKRYPADEHDIELIHPFDEEDDEQQYHVKNKDEL